jgi:hypothetical protein
MGAIRLVGNSSLQLLVFCVLFLTTVLQQVTGGMGDLQFLINNGNLEGWDFRMNEPGDAVI